MRQVVFAGVGRLEVRAALAPRIEGPLQALVAPRVIGRCDLDVLYMRGRMPLAAGEPIGHEIIGEIADLGEAAAKQFRIGQQVIVPAQISCGVCAMCRAGFTGRCEAVPFGASYGMGRAGGFGGGLSDLVRVPFAQAMLVPLPEGVSPAPMIGLADMATDAWRAVGPQLAARPGARVLVVGGAVSVIGLYAVGLAVALGAGGVDYLDADPERRRLAELYGGRAFAHPDAAPDRDYEIVVDAASDAELLIAAIRACGPEAVLTSVAPPLTPTVLPLLEMYFKGLSFHIGRPNCRHGHDGALHAWSAKGFRPELVGPKLYAFEDAPQAWLDPAPYVAVQAS